MLEGETNEAVKEAMTVILKECNYMGQRNIGKTIAKVLENEHRTVQQVFMREFVEAMAIYSQSMTDDRNKGSVQMAIDITNMDKYLPYI